MKDKEHQIKTLEKTKENDTQTINKLSSNNQKYKKKI